MPILRNIRHLYTCNQAGLEISNAAIAWEGNSIVWIGKESELPEPLLQTPSLDGAGLVVVPALIDCHTHLCFAGSRADEFEARCQGASYHEILKRGGGILSTVAATRAASEEHLFDLTVRRAREMLRLGVGTIECKSGYGLDLQSELKILRVYKKVSQAVPVRIVPTFLGAHAIPREHTGNPTAYVDTLVNEILPQVASEKLAKFCDIFVEDGAFSVCMAKRILLRARELGFKLKLHADQLTSCGGAKLAAELQATSADHLENTPPEDLNLLAASGTVAVTLPLASLYLRKVPFNAATALQCGVRVALATDFNPGSSPNYHLPLAMTLGCVMNGLTPHQALCASTINAAHALDLADRLGSLEIGKSADLALIDASDVNHWLYQFQPNCCRGLFIDGNKVV